MTSRDGRWTIVLNGEIFNYRELRGELGHIPWRSETDTEVFLEAVAEWGLEKALGRSVGMFALALWDHRERELLLARDRVGEKPLVYFHDGGTFAFASEMKALAPLHDSRLDPGAVDLYFALGYVPAHHSIFRSTFKLPAGHVARWKDGALKTKRWWFPETASVRVPECADERREQIRDLLSGAVRQRLRADVPIALALSGGMDSSVIAAEMIEEGIRPAAFTVLWDDNAPDLLYAQEVAKHFGLEHEVIRAQVRSLAEQVEATFDAYDEPLADSSSVACVALARSVAGRYKVILNGDGGDEAFGGYRHYEHIAVKQQLKAAAAVVGWRDGRPASTVYVQSKTLFRAAERAALLNGHGRRPGALEELLRTGPFLQHQPTGALKRALWSDRHLSLANGLTYKMDIAMGAHGLEGRAPLLDHRILEWAQNLPGTDLVRGREKKVLLREAYRGILPPAVLSRAKQGFGAPVSQWLAGPLKERAAALLPCPLLSVDSQKNLKGQRLWTLFAFAAWAKRWNATW